MIEVIVNTSFEGIHRYEGAPDEVAYLRVPHRHIFNVRVELEVFDDDREIEFIMLKHRIDAYFRSMCDGGSAWHMGTMSCEQVAKSLGEYLRTLTTPKAESGEEVPTERQMSISVMEDGENGARVSWS